MLPQTGIYSTKHGMYIMGVELDPDPDTNMITVTVKLSSKETTVFINKYSELYVNQWVTYTVYGTPMMVLVP